MEHAAINTTSIVAKQNKQFSGYLHFIDQLALTHKICGILSKKLQKLALSNYYRTCLSKQPYFAIFIAAFFISHKFCRFKLLVDIDQLHNYLTHLTFAYS